MQETNLFVRNPSGRASELNIPDLPVVKVDQSIVAGMCSNPGLEQAGRIASSKQGNLLKLEVSSRAFSPGFPFSQLSPLSAGSQRLIDLPQTASVAALFHGYPAIWANDQAPEEGIPSSPLLLLEQTREKNSCAPLSFLLLYKYFLQMGSKLIERVASRSGVIKQGLLAAAGYEIVRNDTGMKLLLADVHFEPEMRADLLEAAALAGGILPVLDLEWNGLTHRSDDRGTLDPLLQIWHKTFNNPNIRINII